MAGTKLNVEIHGPDAGVRYTTSVDVAQALDTVDAMVEAAHEISPLALKNVASRFLDYDSFGSDSAYLDALDRVAAKLTIASIRKQGSLKSFLVEGTSNAEDSNLKDGPSTWTGPVQAVDHVDAAFQAKWQMLLSVGASPSPDLTFFLDRLHDMAVLDLDEATATISPTAPGAHARQEMPVTKLVVELQGKESKVTYTGVVRVEAPLDDIDDLIEVAPEAAEVAKRAIAVDAIRHVMFGSAQVHESTITKIINSLSVLSITKQGEGKRFAVEGAYGDTPEDNPWSDWIHAVDDAEAMFQARWRMALNEGADPTVDFPSFLKTMEGMNVFYCYEEPVTKEELADSLERLLVAAKRAGVDDPAVAHAEEALRCMDRAVQEIPDALRM